MTTKNSQPAAIRDNYEAITARIIEAMEKGVCPWHKPWASGYYNAKTGHRYRGLNVPVLALCGFSDPRFLTFKQAQSMGGHVRKGERGICVMFWKIVKKETEDAITGEKAEKRLPVLKTFTVFNVEQCEGLELPPVQVFEHHPIEEAEALVANMPKRPGIEHGGQRAYYSPALDYVGMPTPESFESPEAYYSTLFHELTHSTGHRSRVDRFTATDYTAKFGSEPYAKEELVAELGAAFLRAACGITTEPEEANSASYLHGWLSVLKNDRRMLVNAAAQAQKAADFILDLAGADQADEEEEKEPEMAVIRA
jgi:antirestriction protein ArdC